MKNKQKEKVSDDTEDNINKRAQKECEDFLKGKNCELCEQIFEDLLNKTGFYDLVKSPPELVTQEEIDKLGYEKVVDIARKEFINPAEGFARCKMLCRKHQVMIRRDNNERNGKGMDIPKDFSLLRIKKSLI